MHKKSKNRVRIQSGKWRGRNLSFPDIDGVRPTKSMVKETLMSWLRPSLARRHCLDLFVGSGSLAFELASQGAQSVTCLDKNPLVCRALTKARDDLGASNIHIGRWEYPDMPKEFTQPYELVVLDPPFGLMENTQLLNWLASAGLLATGAWVYLEQSDTAEWPNLVGWETLKHKRSGGVQFGLLARKKDERGGM